MFQSQIGPVQQRCQFSNFFAKFFNFSSHCFHFWWIFLRYWSIFWTVRKNYLVHVKNVIHFLMSTWRLTVFFYIFRQQVDAFFGDQSWNSRRFTQGRISRHWSLHLSLGLLSGRVWVSEIVCGTSQWGSHWHKERMWWVPLSVEGNVWIF